MLEPAARDDRAQRRSPPVARDAGAWQPLLDGAEAERTRSAVIAGARACIPAVLATNRGFDLAGGAIGASLLLGALERAGLSDGLPSVAQALRVARRRIGAAPVAGGLWHGAAGLAWVQAQHTGSGPGRASRRALVDWVGRETRVELIDGVVGVGVVGLELGKAGDRLVDAVIARLIALASADECGLSWPAARAPTHDLGMAHGHAGVIAFLAGALDGHEAAREPLVRGVRWLGACARPAPSPWAFPHIRDQAASRLAWCYGDPGVAVAIARAARALGDAEMAAVAADVAVRAARRLGDPSVVDGGLCHGSSGLAHVFARLFQYTGRQACADAARFWIRRTLHHSFGEDPGLVTGATGACLALLAATEARDPRWDRAMLLSA